MKKSMHSLIALTCALAFASSVSAETVYSCYHKTNGNLRVVSAPGQCHQNSERELSWESGSDVEQVINSLLARVGAIEDALGLFNEPPTVDAGDDQTILLSDTSHLEGSASDDGILGPLSFLWENTSGPGEAQFSDPSSSATDVWFTEEGTYEVTLSVNDGYVTVSDLLTLLVYPDNSPPVVDIGEYSAATAAYSYSYPYHYNRGCVFNLDAIVEDDGLPLPLTIRWTADDGGVFPHLNPNYNYWYVYQMSFADRSAVATTFFTSIRWNYTFDPATYFRYYWVTLTLSVNDGYHTVVERRAVKCNSGFNS